MDHLYPTFLYGLTPARDQAGWRINRLSKHFARGSDLFYSPWGNASMSDLLVEFTILPKSANKEPTKYTEKNDQIFLPSIIYFFVCDAAYWKP